jgi:hypothetical protein
MELAEDEIINLALYKSPVEIEQVVTKRLREGVYATEQQIREYDDRKAEDEAPRARAAEEERKQKIVEDEATRLKAEEEFRRRQEELKQLQEQERQCRIQREQELNPIIELEQEADKTKTIEQRESELIQLIQSSKEKGNLQDRTKAALKLNMTEEEIELLSSRPLRSIKEVVNIRMKQQLLIS